MPCSRIATSLSGSKPAFARSTDERRIENGSARTTLSAVTVFVAVRCANVSVNVPAAFRRDGDELRPGRDLPGERGRRAGR